MADDTVAQSQKTVLGFYSVTLPTSSPEGLHLGIRTPQDSSQPTCRGIHCVRPTVKKKAWSLAKS